MFRGLLDGRLDPMSSHIGLIEVPPQRATEAFLQWAAPLKQSRGVELTTEAVRGDIEGVLRRLLPLTSGGARRYVFVPTASTWTAYFDNGHLGTDVFPVISLFAQQLQCRGMHVVAVQDTMKRRTAGVEKRYGAMILEVYGPHQTEWLNFIRAIVAMNDGGRWTFDEVGQPFPFEEVDRYASPRIRDRFTFDMLERYVRELGLFPFEERFYAASAENPAILIEKHGPILPGAREFMLAGDPE